MTTVIIPFCSLTEKRRAEIVSALDTRDGGSYAVRPFPVKALKAFGGGDGYASAFLFGLLNGWDTADCLEFGSASAALLVASHGCSADMPDERKVRDFIARCKAEYGEMVVRDPEDGE